METTERTKEAKYMEGYLEFKEASKVITYLILYSLDIYSKLLWCDISD